MRPVRTTQNERAFDAWNRRRLETPPHELSLEDYVGPFAVGPDGYRSGEVGRLGDLFGRLTRSGRHLEVPELINPHRPDLIFRGHPDRFEIYALDAETGKPAAMFHPHGSWCEPETRGRGVTAEMHWLLAAAGSSAYSIIDFSIGGFRARVAAHGLILNRLVGAEPSPEALNGYERDESGAWRLIDIPTPERWNERMGVAPDPRGLPRPEDDSPSP